MKSATVGGLIFRGGSADSLIAQAESAVFAGYIFIVELTNIIIFKYIFIVPGDNKPIKGGSNLWH